MPKPFRLEETLRQATASGVCTALAFGVSQGENPAKEWYFGRHGTDAKALQCSPKTRFDLASLTKPLSTTLRLLRLVDAGKIGLEDPIGKYIGVRHRGFHKTPIWRLLTHTTGMPAHREYFRGLGTASMDATDHMRAKTAIRRMIANTEPAADPGISEIYSDLGYLCAEWVAEAVAGPLDEQWQELPGHGPDSLHFVSLPSKLDKAPYATTETCPWRKGSVQGEVHDDNCWTMGGIGGHAGLFGTLANVHDQARGWLRALRGLPNQLGISQALMATTMDRKRIINSGTRVMGWDTPTPGASTSGQFFSRRSIGHLGFTGTSLWIDPETEIIMTLLTNRVCPSRDDDRIRPLRPLVHDLAWTWLNKREE